MRMLITAQGFNLSEALRDSVRREVGRFVQSVRRPVNFVSVHLVDAGGTALRGREKLCRVRVEFQGEHAVEGSDAESEFDQSVPEAFIQAMRPS